MRLFKTRKSIDTFGSANTNTTSIHTSYQQHYNNGTQSATPTPIATTCAVKFSKTIAGSTSISSSLPDLHDSPVMILSCTNLSASHTPTPRTPTSVSVLSASNSGASTQTHSPAAGVGAGGSYTHNYSSLNSSGRQTPSALSVASLNDAALQRLHHHHQQQQQQQHHSTTHLFQNGSGGVAVSGGGGGGGSKCKSNTLLVNYGGSSNNIATAQHYYQKLGQQTLGQQRNSSSSSSCIYEKSRNASCHNISLMPNGDKGGGSGGGAGSGGVTPMKSCNGSTISLLASNGKCCHKKK